MGDEKLMYWNDPFLTLNNTNDYPIIVKHYVYDEFENTVIHKHDFIEMVYVISGKGIHVINERTYNISRGHICFVNEDVLHSLFPTDPKNEGNLAVFNCMLKKEYFTNLLNKHVKGEHILNDFIINKSKFVMIQDDSAYQVSSVFENLFNEFTFKRSHTQEMLDLLVVQTFIMVNRLCLKETSSSDSVILNNVLKYIEEHYSERVDILQLSRIANLSKSRLSVLFKKYTGFSIVGYLQKKRIDHACNYIVNGDDNFGDIAFKVGYNDYPFFLKTFKKVTGMTPREFKTINRK